MTDAEWVDQISNEYYAHISKCARQLVKRYHLPNIGYLADDLTQMVFTTLSEQVSKKNLRQHENIVAWLTLVLRNKLGNYCQKRGNSEVLVSDISELKRIPAHTFEISEPFPPGMTAEERYLLYRHYVHSIPCREIAASLGIEPDACSTRILRARAHYRELYSKQQFADTQAEIDGKRKMDKSMLDKGGAIHA